MPPTLGAVVALLFIAMLGYLFWRGTVLVMDAKHLVRDQGALLVDAGTTAQFDRAHIAGALNIPASEVALRHDEIGPRWRPIVVYARSSFDSSRAAHVLRTIGYHSVTSIGPMARWGEHATAMWQGDPPPDIVGQAPDAGIAASDRATGGANYSNSVWRPRSS